MKRVFHAQKNSMHLYLPNKKTFHPPVTKSVNISILKNLCSERVRLRPDCVEAQVDQCSLLADAIRSTVFDLISAHFPISAQYDNV